MKSIITILTLLAFWFPFQMRSQSIIFTAHNLSANGPGSVKSTTGEQRVCIFCHTPHGSNPQAPLWNRSDSGIFYIMYDNSISSTSSIDQAWGLQPTGSSILCLSCHDGTIALGSVKSEATDIFDGSGGTMPAGRGLLSTDLSDDHPISFIYSDVQDAQLQLSPIPPIALDTDGKVQCGTCHDAHNNTYGKFLVVSNDSSALCLDCHIVSDWTGSSHQSSPNTASVINPWAHIGTPIPPSTSPPYNSVAANGCSNCHDTHAANLGGRARLLKSVTEEGNCLDCHIFQGAASTNISGDFGKMYTHPVSSYTGIHDPNESVLLNLGSIHVECQDCHEPHSVTNTAASAPVANGFISGVKGIDTDGAETVGTISFQYELCYRCHADNAVTTNPTLRQLGSNNVRLDFDLNNATYHPVEGPGQNTAPRGLISHTASSVIYCTDCHASDGAAKGPHGSIYPRILKANYNLAENTDLPNHNDATLATEFALCAQCHDMNAVNTIHSGMKQGHFLAYTSCNSCHDPHGFSGGTAANNLFLINLSLENFGPNGVPNLFIELATGNTSQTGGTCNFECHPTALVPGGHNHTHTGSKYTRKNP